MVNSLVEVSGVGAVESATSAWGNFLAWVIENKEPGTVISGSVFTDYFKAHPASAATSHGLVWLYDHAGIKVPSRCVTGKAISNSAAPVTTRRNQEGELHVLMRLEHLASLNVGDVSADGRVVTEFTRCHAAGYAFMMRAALRYKQSVGCVINAIVPFLFQGRRFSVAMASTLKDKNKNKKKQFPRPVWCVVTALDGSSCIIDRLTDMLHGTERFRCIIRDTDSKSGDPRDATAWVKSPILSSSRIDHDLKGTLEAAGCPGEAEAYRHHFAKRFTLSAARRAECFSPAELNEIGRFSGSVAQQEQLMPTAAMLQAVA
jgi:hypothetical protein